MIRLLVLLLNCPRKWVESPRKKYKRGPKTCCHMCVDFRHGWAKLCSRTYLRRSWGWKCHLNFHELQSVPPRKIGQLGQRHFAIRLPLDCDHGLMRFGAACFWPPYFFFLVFNPLLSTLVFRKSLPCDEKRWRHAFFPFLSVSLFLSLSPLILSLVKGRKVCMVTLFSLHCGPPLSRGPLSFPFTFPVLFFDVAGKPRPVDCTRNW